MTHRFFPSAALLALLALFAAAPAQAGPDYTALRQNERVQGELLGASIAYLIDENCPDISLRRLKLAARALSLRSYAKGLGYTGAQVDAYVNDKAEQERFRALAMDWLTRQGLTPDDPASWCAIGRDQIDQGSWIGTILRAS